jgi:hypothetical protein
MRRTELLQEIWEKFQAVQNFNFMTISKLLLEMFKKVLVAVLGSLLMEILLRDFKNVNCVSYCHCLPPFSSRPLGKIKVIQNYRRQLFGIFD